MVPFLRSPFPRCGARMCILLGSSCSVPMVRGDPGGGLRGQWKWEDTPLIAFLPVSRRHFGLLGLLFALGLVVTVLLLNCRGAWRPDDGEEHPRGLQEGWQEGRRCQFLCCRGSRGGGQQMLLDARLSAGYASRTWN